MGTNEIPLPKRVTDQFYAAVTVAAITMNLPCAVAE
jgi:hypothetical protein